MASEIEQLKAEVEHWKSHHASTLQLYHDEQEFNGFVNAKPFDDGWIDEFVKTFVANLPDVRQMAAMNLTIITAKIVQKAKAIAAHKEASESNQAK